MHTIYLDQNKWIELARVATGKNQSSNMADVLTFVRQARDLKLACFPLSLGHYIETQRHGGIEARQRLAKFMIELSKNFTVASPTAILNHELDVALAARFPDRVEVKPLKLLGVGIAHTSDYPIGRPILRSKTGTPIDPVERYRLEAKALELMNESLLSGVMPFTGETPGKPPPTAQALNFQRHLDGLADRFAPYDAGIQHRGLYAIALVDILEPFNAALKRHRISASEFEALGTEGVIEFVDDLPTRRMDVHLHRQVLKNKNLRSKPGDLNDWGYVGVMAMYCDVVVTEKHLANLLRRDGFKAHATVITDLADLPRAVTSLDT